MLNHVPQEDLPSRHLCAIEMATERFDRAHGHQCHHFYAPLSIQLGIYSNTRGLEHLAPSWDLTRRGIQILKKLNLKQLKVVIPKSLPTFHERQQEANTRLGIFYLPVKIDLRVGKMKFQEHAKRLFDELHELSPSATLPRDGKAASLPWTELKELAAYRISRAGWQWKTAQEFLKNHSASNRTAKSNLRFSILRPIGLVKGRKSAQARIEIMYPSPL